MTVDLTIILPVMLGIIATIGSIWAVFSFLSSLKDRITKLEAELKNLQRERNATELVIERVFKQLKEISDKLDLYNDNFRDQKLQCLDKFVTKDVCTECRKDG